MIDEASLVRAKVFYPNCIKLGNRITIFGHTGSGKSWFACYLLYQFAKKQLVVVLDVKDEYNLEELPANFMNKKKVKRGLFRLTSLNIYGKNITDFKLLVEFLSANLFARGDSCLVLEEIGNYINKMGYLYQTYPHTARFLLQGRKRSCSLIDISQRPAQVHTDFPSQSDHLFIFKLNTIHDMDAVKYYLENKYFSHLKKFQFFHVNIGENTTIRCYALTRLKQVHGVSMLGTDKSVNLE